MAVGGYDRGVDGKPDDWDRGKHVQHDDGDDGRSGVQVGEQVWESLREERVVFSKVIG